MLDILRAISRGFVAAAAAAWNNTFFRGGGARWIRDDRSAGGERTTLQSGNKRDYKQIGPEVRGGGHTSRHACVCCRQHAESARKKTRRKKKQHTDERVEPAGASKAPRAMISTSCRLLLQLYCPAVTVPRKLRNNRPKGVVCAGHAFLVAKTCCVVQGTSQSCLSAHPGQSHAQTLDTTIHRTAVRDQSLAQNKKHTCNGIASYVP